MARSRKYILALVALWLVGLSVAIHQLWRYESAAGAAAVAPESWPAGAALPPSRGQFNLVMLLHPRCPCSRASVGELALLMARCEGRIAAQALFFKPSDEPIGWARTSLWRDAAGIPGVTVRNDDGGIEARRFGAATSGQVLLFDPQGRLVFSGGITESRGHSGDNAGRSAIVRIVQNDSIPMSQLAWPQNTPVFGCSLFPSGASCTTPTTSTGQNP